MARVVIPVGYARLCVRWKAGNSQKQICSVFGVKLNDVVTNTATAALSSAVGGAYKPMINTLGSYNGIELLVGQDGIDPLFFASSNGSGVGTYSGANLVSPQVMSLAKKTSASAGRHNRGRTYIADLQEGDVDAGGTISAPYLTKLGTFTGSMMSALGSPAGSTTPWDGMVLLHTEVGRLPTVVTLYAGETRAATMRRRFDR